MVELVSIAISTYEANGKGPEFLTRNLNQIMRQTYENIEIVISDHASDDTIKEVCKKFHLNDLIKIHHCSITYL